MIQQFRVPKHCGRGVREGVERDRGTEQGTALDGGSSTMMKGVTCIGWGARIV